MTVEQRPRRAPANGNTESDSFTAVQLAPSQESAYDSLRTSAQREPISFLFGVAGTGKTTLLETLRRELGGCRLTARAYVEALRGEHPHALEEPACNLSTWSSHNTTTYSSMILISSRFRRACQTRTPARFFYKRSYSRFWQPRANAGSISFSRNAHRSTSNLKRAAML
jgi:hypothetical protein